MSPASARKSTPRRSRAPKRLTRGPEWLAELRKALDGYLDPALSTGESAEVDEALQASADTIRETTEASLHFPEVAARTVGPERAVEWGVFCHGCSFVEGDYVYPCTVNGDTGPPWPPSILIEP